jgi:hypothetical protein
MGFKSTIKQWAEQESVVLDRTQDIVAGVILTRSTMIAPKLTGALKGNGRVYKKNGHRTVKFGDNDVPYARKREFENNKNPQTIHYLKRGGDSVKKENIGKYVEMAR